MPRKPRETEPVPAIQYPPREVHPDSMLDNKEDSEEVVQQPLFPALDDDLLAGLAEEETETAEIDSPSSSSGNADEAAFFAGLDEEINPDDIAAKEASLYLPKGVYFFKEGTIQINGRFSDHDKNQKDLNYKRGKGRTFYDISGIAVHSETGIERRYQFSVSPDVRTWAQGKSKGEADGFTQNYAKVSKYYRKKYGRNHKADKELYNLLKSGNYAFYLTQGNSGNFLGQFQDKDV